MKRKMLVTLLAVVLLTLLFTAACGQSTTEGTTQAACAHRYSKQETLKATCVKNGLMTYTCALCGDSYTEEIPANNQHDYAEELTVASTCTSDGELTYTCKHCNHSYTKKVKASGHSYANKITTNVTCTSDGVRTYTCKNCNDSYTETIKTKGHQYSSRVTSSATCAKDGVRTYTCSGCKDSYTETIPATGNHQYNSSITREPSCTSDGVRTYRCKTCEDSYTESIPGGHKWQDATCTTAKCCTACGATEGTALGHTTTSGTCTRCYAVIFEPVTYSGTGDSVITGVDIPAGSFCIILTHNGKSNFITKFYYDDGEYDYQSLTNEIGAFYGTRALYEHGNKAVNDGMFQIRADGYWTITICKISGSCTTNIKGNGTVVTDLITITNARNVITLTYKGESNFIVKIFEENGDLYDWETLANEIGDYSGQKIVTLTPGKNYFIEVRAKGEWTIDFGLGDAVTTYTTKLPGESDDSNDSVDDNKWSFTDASNLNSYANSATSYMNDSVGYITDALGANNTTYKVLYYRYAISYVNNAKRYLEKMKTLADSRADLELTNSDFDTLQDKIDYALELCDQIADLDIDSNNYDEYADLIFDVAWELYAQCLGIQQLSVSLMELFT